MRKILLETVNEMRSDRSSGKTIEELISKYGCSRSTIFSYTKGFNNPSTIRRNKKRVPTLPPTKRPELSKGDIGEAARQCIISKLMLNGVKIFKPLVEDTPIDLLLLKRNGSVVRCQCKYMYRDKRGYHVLNNHSNGKGEKRGKRSYVYSKLDIDFLLGYCSDNNVVYVVPIEAINGRSIIAVWISRAPMSNTNVDHFNGALYADAFDALL
jgi:hypothetical protein